MLPAMSELRRLPTRHPSTSTRPYLLMLLDDLHAWPIDLPLGNQRFSLLLVLDGRDVAEDGFATWNSFAERAINQGLAYFSTWGPDCERLHDLMDETLVEREVQGEAERDFLMTTWHAEESLEDALEFLKNCAVDHDLQDWRTAPGVIALIGRPDLVTQIEAFPFD